MGWHPRDIRQSAAEPRMIFDSWTNESLSGAPEIKRIPKLMPSLLNRKMSGKSQKTQENTHYRLQHMTQEQFPSLQFDQNVSQTQR